MKEDNEKADLKLNIQKMKIMASSPNTSWQINGETMGTDRLYLLGLQNHYRCDYSHNIKKTIAPWKKSYDQPRQHIKKQTHFFAYKGPYSQSYGFSSSCVDLRVGP